MAEWKTRADGWLTHEQAGHEDAADAEFKAFFAVLPEAQPSQDFVARTAQAAWKARSRRRYAWLPAAAAVFLVAAALVAVGALPVVGLTAGWVLTTVAWGATTVSVEILTIAVTALEWWSVAARASGTLAGAAALPQGMAVLAAIELAGAAALYGLYRALSGNLTARHPRSFCF